VKLKKGDIILAEFPFTDLSQNYFKPAPDDFSAAQEFHAKH